jgi:hypothetical protein
MIVGAATDWTLHTGGVAARAGAAENKATTATPAASESAARAKRVKRETVGFLSWLICLDLAIGPGFVRFQ